MAAEEEGYAKSEEEALDYHYEDNGHQGYLGRDYSGSW